MNTKQHQEASLMDKDSTRDGSVPVLLQELWTLLMAHRPAFGQERPFQRAVVLVFGELFTFARHTVTQILLALGLTDADWGAWYRLFSHGRFDEARLAACLMEQTLAHVPAEEPYVVGVDGTQVPRSSQKMPGTSWLKAPRTPPFRVGIHRAQRFVNGSWLLPLQEGFSRAIPMRLLAAFPEKAVLSAGLAACKEWEAGIQFITWVRQQLDRLGRGSQLLLLLADGAYEKVEFWRGLPDKTVAAVRTAKNRVLRELPGPHCGKGRPRKYGPKALKPQEWLHQKEGWREGELSVRGRVLRLTYRVEGPFLRERVPGRPVFLLVQKGNTWMAGKKAPKRKRREPSYFLISAVQRGGEWVLPLTAERILAWLWQRWELEVTHRELKSGLGLGEKQCWNPCSAVTSVQWSAWVYALLVLAGYRAWGLFGGPKAPGRWWGGAERWSLTTLWRGYRAAFWGMSEFRACWSPTSDNWPKKEAWMVSLGNAVAGSARI
jgi:hypothetical protein